MKSQEKKPKLKSVKYLRKKADRVLQDWGRRQNRKCEICGGKYSCLHHFFPKSKSNNLRYDKDNLIFICVGCHFSHHNGDPRPHASVLERRGQEWYKTLLQKKNKIQKINKQFYQDAINKYEKDL